jgi:YcaO-like protein with predicted kinase domain
MLWIEGRNLLDDLPTWVPFEVVHTNYTLPLPPSSGAFVASSNGLASGNHALEAVSHAIGELVERDAMTLWLAHDTQARARTRVDLATIDDPACATVLDRLEHAGVAVGVWEVTSDVGIPAFRCIIADRDASSLRPYLPGLGSGCHPTREIALLRALTEAAQVRLTLISGARDDLSLAKYARSADIEAHGRLIADIAQVPAECRSFKSAPTFDSDSIDDDLRWQLQRLRAAKISEVVAIDLSKPALGVPVVRVVIPGLEGIHDAPGYRGGARYQAIQRVQA